MGAGFFGNLNPAQHPGDLLNPLFFLQRGYGGVGSSPGDMFGYLEVMEQ